MAQFCAENAQQSHNDSQSQMQRQQYFNHASESDVPHYQQPWVLSAMNAFHTEQNSDYATFVKKYDLQQHV